MPDLQLPEDPKNLVDLICRPARAGDLEDVIALTRTLWDGHDYVPQVWPEWLADPHGQLAVAELAGQVVGLVKLTRFAEDEWWLQGLRVDPAYQGQGVARRLHDYILEIWRHHSRGTLRLSSYRPQVRHLCEGTGFAVIGQYSEFAAPAFPGEYLAESRVRQSAESPDMLLDAAVPVFSRFMEVGWTWINFTNNRLQSAAVDGRAWMSPEGEIWVVREDEDDDGAPQLWLEWIACRPQNLAASLQTFRALGGELGYQQVNWVPPLDETVLEALGEAGFKRSWDGFVWLFEKRSSA